MSPPCKKIKYDEFVELNIDLIVVMRKEIELLKHRLAEKNIGAEYAGASGRALPPGLRSK